MEIIVKRDILDELQSRGVCPNRAEAEKLLQAVIEEVGESLRRNPCVTLTNFGAFSTEKGRDSEKAPEVPSPEFLKGWSERSTLDISRLSRAVQTIFHFIKEMLVKSQEVRISDFANFRLEEKKPQALKSAQRGQSCVLPSRKILVFEAEKRFCEKIGGRQVEFSPVEDFQKHIAKLKTSSILLLVPSKDFFIETFEYTFQKTGWRVEITRSVEEAKPLVNPERTQLVVLDGQIPNHQILHEHVKFNKATSGIPVMVMHPKGTDLQKIQNFRIDGDEEILQPFEIKQMITCAEKALKKALQERKSPKQSISFKFLTTDQHIEKANELCGKMFAMSGINEEIQISVAAAFREALANAAQHGNKHRRDKALEVLYRLEEDKIVISVGDSGSGFDWKRYLDVGTQADAIGRARQSHREGRLGGLGIMLMSRCVDKMEYNEAGNKVVLTKKVV